MAATSVEFELPESSQNASHFSNVTSQWTRLLPLPIMCRLRIAADRVSGRHLADSSQTRQANMKSKRILELDALRGLAAIAVLLFHFTYRYQELYSHTQVPPFQFRLGYLGVQLFFIVSGFVIFMTIDRTETPLDFVVSRFSRLYPTFWVGVLVTTLVVMLSGLPGTQRSPFEIAVNLTMFHEFFGVPAVDGVYWTLTQELLFYGLVLCVFSIGWMEYWLPFAYAWLGLQAVANLSMHALGDFPWKIRYFLMTEYCHLFIAGIAFYQIYQGKASRWVYGLLSLACVNHFLLHVKDLPASRMEEGAIVVMFFGVILAIVKGHAKFLAAKPLVWLGSISYALYLVHQFLGYSIIRAFESNGLSVSLGISVSILLSVVLSALITLYVERPAISLIRDGYRRWKQSDATVPTLASVELPTDGVADLVEQAPVVVATGELTGSQRFDQAEGSPTPQKAPKPVAQDVATSQNDVPKPQIKNAPKRPPRPR